MSADPDAEDGGTADHVFWEVFGAHATVGACRRCNSRIGDQIEGKLIRGNELYARGKWRGAVVSDNPAFPDPVAVDVDLEAREVRLVKPVTSRVEGNERHFRVEGSREQVRQVLRGGLGKFVGWTNEEVDSVVANAHGTPWNPTVNIDIRHDLNLARRLTAKMVLGAGALADTGFVTTDLASSLRDILWAKVSPVQLVFTPALEAMSSLYDLPGLYDRPLFDSSVAAGQAFFVPIPHKQETVVFARLNTHLVGGAGFVVSGVWPRASEFPVAIEDLAEGLSIRIVMEDVLRWTSATAE